MPSALITGGAGFFGGLLKRDLLARGWRIVSIDLERDEDAHANLTSVRGDIRDGTRLDALFASNRFDAVFHCAAILAHAVRDRNFLWTSNVLGTRKAMALIGEKDVGHRNLLLLKGMDGTRVPGPETVISAGINVIIIAKPEFAARFRKK